MLIVYSHKYFKVKLLFVSTFKIELTYKFLNFKQGTYIVIIKKTFFFKQTLPFLNTSSSQTFKEWQKIPFGIVTKIYLFNITNPNKVENFMEPPHLQEVGKIQSKWHFLKSFQLDFDLPFCFYLSILLSFYIQARMCLKNAVKN